jgi:hypothetical protein
MCRSKIFYSLVMAGLLVFGSATHAAVHDFGNILKASPNYAAAQSSFTQLATNVDGFGKWTFEQSSNNNSFNRSGEGAFSGSMRSDFVPDAGVRTPATSLIDSSVLSPVVYIDVRGTDGAYSAQYQPVAAVPEPETYVMLLAGFGLLCFSARRRKNDSFD